MTAGLARHAALARHVAHGCGGWRAALVAGAVAAAAGGLGTMLAAPAEAPVVAAGLALAAAAAAAGLATGVGAAGALGRSPALAVLAATPTGRGAFAAAACAGIAWQAAVTLAGAAAGGALALAVVGGAGQPAARWGTPSAIEGAVGARSGPAVRWAGAGQALVARFEGLDPGDLPDGPLRVRLRLRLALSESPAPGAPVAESPVRVAAGPPGAVAPLDAPLGNPWGPEGLTATVPRERLGAGGRFEVAIAPAAAGLALGAAPADVRLALRPSSLLATYARGALGLLAPVVLVALLAGACSVGCSRGVSLTAGLGAAVALALAPLAREALADLPPPQGLAAATARASGWLLAALPRPVGAVDAALAGESLPWAAVAGSAATHLPALAVCVAVAWWWLRQRDW